MLFKNCTFAVINNTICLMKEKLTDFIKNKLDALNLKHIKVNHIQVKHDHVVITINGGENGTGRWQSYLGQIDAIVRAFDGSWVVDIQNDCPDDVWTLRLGWRMNEEMYSLLPVDLSAFAKDHSGCWIIKVGEDDDFLLSKTDDRAIDDNILPSLLKDLSVGEARNLDTGEKLVADVDDEDNEVDNIYADEEKTTELIKAGLPTSFVPGYAILDGFNKIFGIDATPVLSVNDFINILPSSIVAVVLHTGTAVTAYQFIHVEGNDKDRKYHVGYQSPIPIGEKFPSISVKFTEHYLVNALVKLTKWCCEKGFIKAEKK